MQTLQAAQNWIGAGFSVIPIGYRSKRPAFDALKLTRSVAEDGHLSWESYKSHAASPQELQMWFSGPRRNIGVVTGWNGLVVLDFDQRDAYDAWLGWTHAAGGRAASIAAGTYRVHSARGVHVYVICEEPVESYQVGAIDVKARFGYVLAPPSVHPSGHQYQGHGAQIMRCSRLAEVFPFEKPAPEIAASSWASTDDPWEAASRAVVCGGVGAVSRAAARVTTRDLVQVVREDRPGSWALCPLHSDTNPSLRVYADGHWHCFGCGAHGGDAIDLYAAMHRITLREAIAQLGGV
jgi:hypothetical protein